MACQQLGIGTGDENDCLMYRVSFWGDEDILELNRGAGCSTLCVLSTMELHRFRWLIQSLCLKHEKNLRIVFLV
jgi:hypothetical protein